MKKLLIYTFGLIVCLISLAQSPAGFNYQAVIRNGSGEIMIQEDISLRVRILQGSPSGSSVHSETFNETTNAFGLVNLVIGTIGDLSTIDWSSGPFFLETGVDLSAGTNFTILGTSQLMSVPYSLFAETTVEEDGDPENELQEISTDDSPGNITISDGSTLTLNVEDGDADPENEIQDLELIGNIMRVTGNATANEIFLGGQNYFGDTKHSFATADHAGWFILNGRQLTNLPETARQNAADLGFTDALPDAGDRFLKGKASSESVNEIGGSNLIEQGNIPNFILTGSSEVDGTHAHGYYGHTGAVNVAHAGTGASVYFQYQNKPAGSMPAQATTGTGIHQHEINLNSGGNGDEYYQPYLVTNVFIYLGGLTLGDLQDLGQTNQEILDAGISPNALWSDNNEILDDLLGLTYQGEPITLQTFVDEGISLSFLYDQYANQLLDETTASTLDLYEGDVTIATMDANFSDATTAVAAMRTDGISLVNIFSSGVYSLQELEDGGFTILELLTVSDYATLVAQSVATYQEFLNAGETPLEIWMVNDDVLDELLGLTYSGTISLQTFVDESISITFLYGQYGNDLLSQTTVNTLGLFEDGVSIADMDGNSVSLAVMVADGIAIADLYASELYTLQQLKDNFDAASMLSVATVTELLNEDGSGTDITIFELRAGGALDADFYGVEYQGGLIFYTLSDGTTYIAENLDQSSGITWAITGSVSTDKEIGDGQTNTEAILAFDAGPNAASTCSDYVEGTYSDWYLPSEREMDEIYDNLKASGLGEFSNSYYWTSTDDGGSRAVAIDFSNGNRASGSNRDRVNTYRVRPIRSFVSAPD